MKTANSSSSVPKAFRSALEGNAVRNIQCPSWGLLWGEGCSCKVSWCCSVIQEGDSNKVKSGRMEGFFSVETFHLPSVEVGCCLMRAKLSPSSRAASESRCLLWESGSIPASASHSSENKTCLLVWDCEWTVCTDQAAPLGEAEMGWTYRTNRDGSCM